MQAILQKDRKLHAATTGMVVEALLTSDPSLVKKACICIQGWYRDIKDHPPTLIKSCHLFDDLIKGRALPKIPSSREEHTSGVDTLNSS